MNKLYRNRDWLYEQYIIKEKSINQIVKEYNCCKSSATIQNWMKKFGISRRSRSEAIHLAKANHCQLTYKMKEFIDGELLGDGCIRSQNSYSADFKYISKYEEYINYIVDTLKFFGIEQVGKINKKWKKNLFPNFSYASLSYSELFSFRRRWHPNGKKIVPKDIKLTPLTCRQWYIGDGSLLRIKNQNPCIMLYTNGFLKEDVEWLVQQLNNLGFKTTRQLSNNSIHISTYSTQDFLNYIDNCPVECYKYKWNI